MSIIACPSCPDGYEWDENGPTGRACPVCEGIGYVEKLYGPFVLEEDQENQKESQNGRKIMKKYGFTGMREKLRRSGRGGCQLITIYPPSRP